MDLIYPIRQAYKSKVLPSKGITNMFKNTK